MTLFGASWGNCQTQLQHRRKYRLCLFLLKCFGLGRDTHTHTHTQTKLSLEKSASSFEKVNLAFTGDIAMVTD